MSWPHHDRLDLVAIAIGGVAGATLRWLVIRPATAAGGWFEYAPNTSVTLALELGFPTRTLIVNVLGCLLLGALTAMLTRSLPLRRRLLVGATAGFCGSLTTFSTFAVEVAERLRGLPGETSTAAVDPLAYGPEVGAALTYLVVSLLAGGLAFWLGRTTVTRSVISSGAITLGGAE